MASAPLHPHSTTHSQSGAPLPALHMAMRGAAGGHSASGSSRSLESELCFSPCELGARGPFDAHAFVSKCLSTPNPALMGASDDAEAAADAAISTQAAALLQREAAGDADGTMLTMPEHSASPSLPLELLREHLTRYQLYVKGELVELLNAEYARFIGLSSSLSGLDHSIGAIESQLAVLAREVDALHQRLHSDALAPFQHKLLSQHAHEKNKQSYLHMVVHVLGQMKSLATLVANEGGNEGADEEAERGGKHIESKQKEQADGASVGIGAVTPAQQRLVAHHLSASHARHQQRAAELKQQRRANAARGLESSNRSSSRRTGGGSSQHAQGAYADLKLDIPPWMLRQYGGHSAAAGVDSDAESDFADEDDEEDASDEDDDGVEVADEDGADAFGLYQALLQSHPSPSAPAPAPADSPSSSPEASLSPALASLRARLVRVERASASLSSLRALIPLCKHFHVVRDLCASDGASGPFDALAEKVREQTRECFAAVLEQLGAEYEKQLPVESSGSTASAASPLPEAQFSPALVSLLRSSLRALTFLDVRAEAEEMVRATLVRPVLRRRVQAAMPALRAAHAMDEDQYWLTYGDAAGTGQTSSTPHPLRALYVHLLHFLRGPIRLLVEACAVGDDGAAPAFSAHSLQSGGVASLSSPSPSGGRLPLAPLLPYSFLGASYFAEVVSFLSGEVGSLLFSSGLPHVFLAHFHATKAFLAEVDAFAAEQLDTHLSDSSTAAAASAAQSPSVAALHAHPSWVAFDKRWNVGIYFQLRFQTIAAGLEGAVAKAASSSNGGAGIPPAQLAAGKAVVPSAMPEPLGDSFAPFSAVQSCDTCFHMEVSSSLWRSLCACFSPRIFLAEAAPRFLKLALQCLARWASWAEGAAAAAGSATHAGGMAGLGSLQAPEAQLLLLVADAQRMLQLLASHLLPLVARVLGVAATSPRHVQAALRSAPQQQQGGEANEDEALLRAVCGAFSPSLSRLSALSNSASAQLGDLLLSRCTPALSYVSRIKPAYRFSRQPTHALQYVRAMLQPVTRVAHAIDAGDVRPLLGSGSDGGAAGGGSGAGGEMDVNEGMADDASDTAPLPPPSVAAVCGPLLGADARAALLRDVLGRLSVAYAAEAAKVLSGDIFGELSKKLNKRTAAVGGVGVGAGAGSEVDKTRRQLHLDATLFARIVREQIAARDTEEIIQPLVQATQLNA